MIREETSLINDLITIRIYLWRCLNEPGIPLEKGQKQIISNKIASLDQEILKRSISLDLTTYSK